MFNLTQWRWLAHLEYLERLHCYAASETSNHLSAHSRAIATTCAQGVLRPLFVAPAGMAIRVLSKRVTAHGLC